MSSKYGKSAFIIMACIIIDIAGLFLNGCWSTHRVFFPIKGEQPVIMFDNYKLNIHGTAEGYHNIICETSSIRKFPDTLDINTIPIFLIDSLCFYGDCLDSQACYHPQPSRELFPLMSNESKGPGSLSVPIDLSYRPGEYLPCDFYLLNTLRLRPACKDAGVAVEIRAIMIERATGKELANESKKIGFLIKKETKLDVGY
jgi:hypothetical protein